MPDRFFFYEDENGERQDADIHEPVLDNPAAQLLYTLRAIRGHVDDGHSLEEAAELFGDADLLEACTSGRLTLEDIDEAIAPDEDDE